MGGESGMRAQQGGKDGQGVWERTMATKLSPTHRAVAMRNSMLQYLSLTHI